MTPRTSTAVWPITTLVVFAACQKPKAPPAAAATTSDTSSVTRPLAGAPPGDPRCPATGEWAQCSVLYRLDRAGLAPHLDSTATPDDKSLKGQGFVVKLGRIAKLEVYLYPDSAARIADERSLDKSDIVTAAQPQTIKRERTLIENANLLALLTSINDHQRERVSDALTAGAPQPPTP